MIRRIFISSVQRELAKERKAIVDAVVKNPPRICRKGKSSSIGSRSKKHGSQGKNRRSRSKKHKSRSKTRF